MQESIFFCIFVRFFRALRAYELIFRDFSLSQTAGRLATDHRKFYWVEQDCWIQLNVSAAGLRTINKIGLDAALKQAAEKGYLYE